MVKKKFTSTRRLVKCCRLDQRIFFLSNPNVNNNTVEVLLAPLLISSYICWLPFLVRIFKLSSLDSLGVIFDTNVFLAFYSILFHLCSPCHTRPRLYFDVA
jgi:hypothetical protein